MVDVRIPRPRSLNGDSRTWEHFLQELWDRTGGDSDLIDENKTLKATIASPVFTGTISIGDAEISEAELEILDGATLSTAELNVLDGYTGSVTELNYLDTLHATGVTDTEFDYLDGVTSNVQTQLDARAAGSTGLWTPTWTGFSTAPTGYLRWQKFTDGTNTWVTVRPHDGTARTNTSNATAMTITGIPSEIRPDVDSNSQGVLSVTDNGATNLLGIASVSPAGVITFYLVGSSSTTSASAWTNSGTKGIPGWASFSYSFYTS